MIDTLDLVRLAGEPEVSEDGSCWYEGEEVWLVDLPEDTAEAYRKLLDHPKAFLTGAWQQFVERALEEGIDDEGRDRRLLDHIEINFLIPLGLV